MVHGLCIFFAKECHYVGQEAVLVGLSNKIVADSGIFFGWVDAAQQPHTQERGKSLAPVTAELYAIVTGGNTHPRRA